MTTPKQDTRVSAAEWRARYAEMRLSELEVAKRAPPDRPKFLITELEYTLANPPPHAWRTVKAPSDPKAAFQAIHAYLEGR